MVNITTCPLSFHSTRLGEYHNLPTLILHTHTHTGRSEYQNVPSLFPTYTFGEYHNLPTLIPFYPSWCISQPAYSHSTLLVLLTEIPASPSKKTQLLQQQPFKLTILGNSPIAQPVGPRDYPNTPLVCPLTCHREYSNEEPYVSAGQHDVLAVCGRARLLGLARRPDADSHNEQVEHDDGHEARDVDSHAAHVLDSSTVRDFLLTVRMFWI